MLNLNRLPREVLLLSACLSTIGCVDQALHQDATGKWLGTGVVTSQYDAGQDLRRDTYKASKLVSSEWYTPDGSIVARTDWSSDGSGLDFYLHQNGEVRLQVQMKDGLANGPFERFDDKGNRIAHGEYVDGVVASEVKEVKP